MKNILSLTQRLFKQHSQEIQEAPRFEEWYNQMFPKDSYKEEFEEFYKTMWDFKNEQRCKLTKGNAHSQSF